MKTTARVAAIQAAPVFLDVDACLDKTRSATRDAASRGAEFVVFPETWLPGLAGSAIANAKQFGSTRAYL